MTLKNELLIFYSFGYVRDQPNLLNNTGFTIINVTISLFLK